MKRFYRLFSTILILAMAAWGIAPALAEEDGVALPQLDDCFTLRDLLGEWDATAVEILLTSDSAETRSHTVSIDGGTVTILDSGVYVLSGTLSDGSIIVDIEDDERVQLVLNGVEIRCSSGPAIRILQADKVFITLAEGTDNTLVSDGFSEEGVEAVIYSGEDLTFNGTGALTIDSPTGDGIDGKDDVKFASGSYTITAAGRGIDANDSIRIAGGSFTIVSEGDAIRARHESNGDLGYVYIWDGDFNLTAGGGAANGATHADAMFPGGGMMQGMRNTGGELADFAGEGGEMPEMPAFGGEYGEMPTPPEYDGESGEMPERPDFNGEEGERPTPPDFDGEGGELPAPPGFDVASDEQSGNGIALSDSDQAEDTLSCKGIKASGDIVILGGSFSFDTADDALHAGGDLVLFDGTLDIASGDDGVHADGTLSILGGTVDIAQSYEGLEAKVIAILGGEISLYASDDGLNASDGELSSESFDAQEGVLIEISGGTLYVNADGDGIDSNGDLSISGGTVVVSGPQNNMNGALDYNGEATVSGGTVVAAGAAGMAENFSDSSTQAAFFIELTSSEGEITVTDQNGSVLTSATVEKSFGTVVVSCPELVVGETYTVSCGEASAQITLTDTVTGADTGGMGGMGTGFLSNEMPAFGRQEDSGEE